MSSSEPHKWFDEGWKQIRAGVTLIGWSKLASWNEQDLALVPANEAEFESASGHQQVHKEFGRLICWIAFSVGAEYFAKGVCLVNNRDLTEHYRIKHRKDPSVIRPPYHGENIESWIELVLDKNPTVYVPDLNFGTLGNLIPHLEKIIKPGQERDMVLASIRFLACTIRNRDAHRYASSVRAFHSHTVESLFVPAFNILLKSVDKEELRIRLKGLVFHRGTGA